MHQLYTIGYAGLSAAALQAWVAEHRALVVDTRMNAYSPRPEWAKAQLAKRFGPDYVHEQALGNVNYKTGGDIVIKDPATGYRTILAGLAERPVVLLCGCKDVDTCHRKFIADAVEASIGAPAIHLAPGDLAARPAPGEVPQVDVAPDGDVVQRGLFTSADDLLVNPSVNQLSLL